MWFLHVLYANKHLAAAFFYSDDFLTKKLAFYENYDLDFLVKDVFAPFFPPKIVLASFFLPKKVIAPFLSLKKNINLPFFSQKSLCPPV